MAEQTSAITPPQPHVDASIQLVQKFRPFLGKQQSTPFLHPKNDSQRWQHAFVRLTRPAAQVYDRQHSIPSLTEQALEAFKQQKPATNDEPVTTTSRPANIYHLVIIFTFIRTRKVKKELAECKLHIQELKDELAKLSKTVSCLVDKTATQKSCLDQHSSLLKVQQRLFVSTILRHRADLEKQLNILDQQQLLIQRLLEERLHHDSVVDMLLIAMSAYLSYSAVVKQLLYNLLHVIQQPNLQIWLHQLSTILLTLTIYLLLRRLRVKDKIHGSAGHLYTYLHVMGMTLSKSRLLHNLLKRLIGKK